MFVAILAGAMIVLSILFIMLSLKLRAVNKRLLKEKENREKVASLVNVMLEDQQNILSADPQYHLYMQAEVSKYIRDYLIGDLVKGDCPLGEYRYADAMVRKRYWKQMDIFKKDPEERFLPWA